MKDDDDLEEDERGINRISGNKCRTCGRIGCEGGPSCDTAAELKEV